MLIFLECNVFGITDMTWMQVQASEVYSEWLHQHSVKFKEEDFVNMFNAGEQHISFMWWGARHCVVNV